MATIAAFVIAGGQSSRMGRDKAFLELDGRTLLERALEVARSVSDDVKIVGQREKFSAYGDVVEDIYPGQGPLAGIHAALRSSTAELNLMIGVDTPFLDTRFVQYLIQQAEASGATVTVPVTGIPYPVSPDPGETRVGHSPVSSFQSPDAKVVGGAQMPKFDARNQKLETRNLGQAQPLCAVYRREFARIAEEALRQRRNNIVPLFARVRSREISDSELRKLAFDPIMFENLNTPEEWEEASKRARK
jgi:molybdopterin-guanine dinucleotide biosynthesis protein A